jgi:hypothetical protein
MPTYSTQVNPSSIFIFATNSETRPYTAIIDFDWTHDSYGQIIQQHVNTVANVPANLNNGIIYQLSGAYVNIQVPNGFSVQFS